MAAQMKKMLGEELRGLCHSVIAISEHSTAVALLLSPVECIRDHDLRPESRMGGNI